MQYHRLFTAASIALITLFSVLPLWAQAKPIITLQPAWASSRVLTSLNNDANPAVFPSDNNDNIYMSASGQDDEVNYAVLDLIVTTDTEIWAVDLSCSFQPNLLEIYPIDTSVETDNPTDNQYPFRPSPLWGATVGTHYTQINFPYTPGTMHVVLSKMGQTTGLGVNGQTTTFSLGTITARIRPQSITFEADAKVSCTYSIVDRNGIVIGASAFPLVAPSLSIRAGYLISGKVTHQSRGAQNSVGVSCQTNTSNARNDAFVFRTDATGAFKVGGLRTFGVYRCQYFANLVGLEAAAVSADKDAEPYLAGQSFVPLFTEGYALQPIVLRGGNTYRTADAEQTINIDDLSAVTGTFGSAVLTPFASGDANGDKKIDKSDLALVTSNFLENEYVSQGHYLIAGQTLPSAVPYDSRISITTTPDDWSVQELRQLIPGTNRDFWPAVSPDGSQIAFVRSIGTGLTNRYALFVMPATGAGTPVQITPANADYDAFAPSWSPDGKRLAFIRTLVSVSGSTLIRNYGINNGWLTLVNLNTRSITLTLGIETPIYPAAWFNDDTLIYGSTVTSMLEKLRIAANTTSEVSGLMVGGGAEDMPNIVNGNLYYRYDPDADYTTVDAELRFATLTNVGGNIVFLMPYYNPLPTPNSFGRYHTIVPTAGAKIGYYSVDRNRGQLVLQFATVNYAGTGSWSTKALMNGSQFSEQVPEWNTVNQLSLPLPANPSWNGLPSSPSDLHAFRSTVISLP